MKKGFIMNRPFLSLLVVLINVIFGILMSFLLDWFDKMFSITSINNIDIVFWICISIYSIVLSTLTEKNIFLIIFYSAVLFSTFVISFFLTMAIIIGLSLSRM